MKISACILTKNEVENIEKCLQNIAPYVDEIVIVEEYSESLLSFSGGKEVKVGREEVYEKD